MTKRYMLALSVILCALLTTIAIAQEAKEPQKSETTPTAAAKAYTGEVTSIDAAKNEVVLKDDAGAEVRLVVSSSTKIIKAGKTIALADIKVGDKLTGECTMSGDGCNAKLITVVPPKPNQ